MNIEPDSSLELQKELEPAEKLLWSGRPRQGLLFRSADALQIPFSLLWCGFAIFWEWGVLHIPEGTSGAFNGLFALWGIPFVCVGLYMVFGRFLMDIWQRSETRYAVTDRRVLIVTDMFSYRVKSLDLRTISDLTMTEKSRGEGTITFGKEVERAFGTFPGWPGRQTYAAPRLEAVPGAREVYRIIRDAQSATR